MSVRVSTGESCECPAGCSAEGVDVVGGRMTGVHTHAYLNVSQGEGRLGGRRLINVPAHLHHYPHATATG